MYIKNFHILVFHTHNNYLIFLGCVKCILEIIFHVQSSKKLIKRKKMFFLYYLLLSFNIFLNDIFKIWIKCTVWVKYFKADTLPDTNILTLTLKNKALNGPMNLKIGTIMSKKIFSLQVVQLVWAQWYAVNSWPKTYRRGRDFDGSRVFAY